MRGKFDGLRRAKALVPTGLLLVLLAGCGRDSADSGSAARLNLPANCPRIGLLGEAADLSRFRPGGGQDLSALELAARISGFQARCDYTDRRRALEVRLTVRIQAERGPAAQARSADLPWFAAVTDADGETILNKREFVTGVGFPPNSGRVTVTADEISITLPLVGQRGLGDYALLIGFQLSPEELEANRRLVGRR